MRPRLKLVHKGIILVTVPLVLNLAFLAILSWLLNQSEIEVKRQVRSKEIIAQANSLSKLFYDAGVAMGGYSITKSPLFADRYDKIVREIPESLEQLKGMVGDNKHQQDILHNLAQITERGLQLLGEAKAAIDENQVDVAQYQARHMYKEIRGLADQLQQELKGLTDEEKKVQEESPESKSRWQRGVKVFIIVGVGVNVLLAFIGFFFFIAGISRGLNVLTDNADRLARGDKLNQPIAGGDEVAVVDNAFHTMAEALAEASRKERAVIENAADVICSVDADGKFVAVSPASEATFGYKPDELMGRRFIELIVPEDVNGTIKAVRAIRSQRGTMPFENRVKRKDTTSVNILWSAFWSETERSLFCVAHDITERKLAEEAIKASERRIRTVIENMMVALVIITRDGRIESVNPQAERIFGYRSDEMVGRHVVMLFQESKKYSETDEGADREKFMESLFTISLYKIGEFDCLKRTGEDFPVELSLTEFQGPEGTRFMANILDVSERREVERLKKEFVATVSHELRTPLTSIRGSLTLLNVGALGALPEKAKQVVAMAERNTLRLITLINDILDIEKLESGKLDMVFDTVPIRNVIERSMEAVKSFAEQNGIKLEAGGAESMVHADGDRLVQVIVNLVSNAVKFSPKGETVRIAVEESPNWIEVKVIDHGRGIPAKYKNLLFQRFQQVEASDSRKKGGTGLGLAICKGIIEQHGGSIGVDSEEGQGSTFWFRIPPANAGARALEQKTA
jgi:PAS domain S-box-containing protein